MANLTSPYGRQDVAWPDLGSDPGVTLHSQITSAIAYLSNNVTARWSGSLTLGASATAQIIHNFDSALAGLKIFVVEAGAVLSKAQQDAAYTFTFVNNDTVQVQNISGVSKTFQVYVYPSALNIRADDLDPAIDISTTGSVYLQNRIAGQQANNGQNGTLVTLTEPTVLHTVLTSPTLSSVQGIAAPADSRGRVVIFTNGTGGVVSFSNDAGTAANRLLTGTGADLQLDNNASVLLKYDTSVSKWRVIGSTGGGSSAITVEQAHSFTVGQAILFNGTSYVTAQANTAANAEVIGIVSKVVDGDTFQYVSNGEITGLSGLTSGEVYFLSDATPGLLTVTEPTTVGSISIPVGIATSTTKLMVGIKRGIVVGGANVRTQIGLANNATTTVQNASGYDAGSLSGWVYIDATTDLRFYVQAQFAKKGAAVTDYDLSYQTTGDTPPAGFSLTITNAGLIQAVMPSIAGFSSAYINFALNAPAVGATLPLQIASTNVSFSDIQAASSAGITFKENDGATVGSVNDLGYWNFGPAETQLPAANMVVHGGTGDGDANNTTIALTRRSSTGNRLAFKLVANDKDTNYTNLEFMGKTTASQNESTAFYTTLGSVDGQSGAWTLGASGNLTARHLYNGYAIRHNVMLSTSTSANNVVTWISPFPVRSCGSFMVYAVNGSTNGVGRVDFVLQNSPGANAAIYTNIVNMSGTTVAISNSGGFVQFVFTFSGIGGQPTTAYITAVVLGDAVF